MEIVMDGLIFQNQTYGGISRIYSEIIPRMCFMDDTLQFTFLTTNRLRKPLPKHSQIKHLRLFPVDLFLRPSKLWQPVKARLRANLQSWILRDSRRKIWHSTYYTRPNHWAGAEIVTVVDMIHERYPNLFNRSKDKFFKKQKHDCVLNADKILCISETTRHDIIKFYGIEFAKTKIIPLAHSPIFRKLSKKDISNKSLNSKPFFLYVGKRNHYKNFSFLLRGYSVWSKRINVDLIVVGDAWTRKEKKFLGELNIENHIKLLTKVTDDNLVELYNLAQAFIFPSLYEGFGIPLLEAMSCGCPVIASRIPSTEEVACELPIYFDPNNIDSFLSAMDLALIEGKDSSRVKLGIEHVKQYSWERTAKLVLDVYRQASQNIE